MVGKRKPTGKQGQQGSKDRLFVLGTSSESNYNSLDEEDNDLSEDEQPKKKSRGYTSPKRASPKVTAKKSQDKGTQKGKARKTTQEYSSDGYSSSEDYAIARASGSKEEHAGRGRTTIDDLLRIIDDKDKRIKSLELELAKSRMTTRMNKTKVQEELKWTGKETNFSDTVGNFCRCFLFPRTKFLKDGWKDYLPDDRDSLYALCMCRLKIPERAGERDIWERVMVPTIMRKYQHMKCNLNNEIKSIYLSMTEENMHLSLSLFM
jgi:hypothetical protein